jgi:CHAD domain-containing protein
VADVVRATVQTGFERILDHEYLLRFDVGDPPGHAVHQTRVAARRLRSDLRTFRSVLDPVWVRHVRSDLRWLGTQLGRVRDADVLGQHLDLAGSPAREVDGRGELGDELLRQRRAAADELAAALRSERYLDLLDRLHAAATRPPFLVTGTGRTTQPGDRASAWLMPVVERPWRTLRKRVGKAGHHPTDRRLHRIRIGAKQLRYAAEAAEPVVGKQARRLARAAEALQTQLGDHHDAVVAEAWLRQTAGHGRPKAAFVAGQLAAEQIRRQRTLRHGWRSTWRKVDRRARKWLR